MLKLETAVPGTLQEAKQLLDGNSIIPDLLLRNIGEVTQDARQPGGCNWT